MTKLRDRQVGVDAVTRIGRALDHPLRVRALAALLQRELCVCELVELLGLAPSTISKHMSVIADAGLVNRRREGRWTYYSLPDDTDGVLVHALSLVKDLVAGDPVIVSDRNRIPGIACSPEE